MTMLPDQKADFRTKVTVSRERGHRADYLTISLAPVLTGTRGDHYDCVRLALSKEDAVSLRDQLTEQLIEMATGAKE